MEGLETFQNFSPAHALRTGPRAGEAAEKPERRRKLEEKQARIKAELQRLDAREQQAERKRETRRKILAGALMFDWIERGEVTDTRFKDEMDRFLERDRDRALFGLSKRPSKKES